MRTPEWITAHGLTIPLAHMTSAHITAVMNYIRLGTGEFGPLLRSECSGFTNFEWLVLCKTELLKRSRAGQL
jgi:hypothetical protein